MTPERTKAWEDYWKGLGPRPGRPVDLAECKRVAAQINAMPSLK